jgi:two-component system cell cycle sensor histidine kinase/response regulator CckA
MATILLVENEPVLAGLIRSTLRVDGHEISDASCSVTALELARQHREAFDLILTEMSLGVELTKLWSHQRHDTKIMFMTDHLSTLGAIYSLWDRVSVLEKPFTANKLRRTVRDTLSRGAKPKSRTLAPVAT